MLALLFFTIHSIIALPSLKPAIKPYRYYYPKVHQETFSILPQNHRSLQDPIDFGINYLTNHLSPANLKITQSYKDSSGIYHIYAVEVQDGIEIDNHNAAVHVKNSQVLSYSSSFTPGPNLVKRRLSNRITLDQAVAIAETTFDAKRDDFPPRDIYIEREDGTIALAFQFQLRDDEKDVWLLVAVGDDGEIIEVIDYYNHFEGLVVPLPNMSPLEGGFESIQFSQSPSSPLGWQDDSEQVYTDTQGNNCISMLYYGGQTLNSSDFMNLYDHKSPPDIGLNPGIGVLNAFYLTNYIHDLSYQYGFTELAGNFQHFNFGLGGKQDDPVTVLCQSGYNNANFATPGDGQKPRMRLYIFSPDRDSSLDSTIPTHEIMHGITNRLTGGTKSGCLATEIGRGLGEGWADFLAMFVTRSTGVYSDVLMGAYVRPGGVRTRPYSIDMEINNLTLSVIKGEEDVHVIGELWMSALFEVYWILVDKFGFSIDFMDSSQRKGNIMMMVMVMTGLKLQPCNPGIEQAREAILAADEAHYKGENFCSIWKGFAKRGLGTDVDEENYKDGFSVPEECLG